MSGDLRTRDGLARFIARAIDDWSASSLPMSASEFVAARLLAGRVLDADPDTPTAESGWFVAPDGSGESTLWRATGNPDAPRACLTKCMVDDETWAFITETVLRDGAARGETRQP